MLFYRSVLIFVAIKNIKYSLLQNCIGINCGESDQYSDSSNKTISNKKNFEKINCSSTQFEEINLFNLHEKEFLNTETESIIKNITDFSEKYKITTEKINKYKERYDNCLNDLLKTIYELINSTNTYIDILKDIENIISVIENNNIQKRNKKNIIQYDENTENILILHGLVAKLNTIIKKISLLLLHNFLTGVKNIPKNNQQTDLNSDSSTLNLKFLVLDRTEKSFYSCYCTLLVFLHEIEFLKKVNYYQKPHKNSFKKVQDHIKNALKIESSSEENNNIKIEIFLISKLDKDYQKLNDIFKFYYFFKTLFQEFSYILAIRFSQNQNHDLKFDIYNLYSLLKSINLENWRESEVERTITKILENFEKRNSIYFLNTWNNIKIQKNFTNDKKMNDFCQSSNKAIQQENSDDEFFNIEILSGFLQEIKEDFNDYMKTIITLCNNFLAEKTLTIINEKNETIYFKKYNVFENIFNDIKTNFNTKLENFQRQLSNKKQTFSFKYEELFLSMFSEINNFFINEVYFNHLESVYLVVDKKGKFLEWIFIFDFYN